MSHERIFMSWRSLRHLVYNSVVISFFMLPRAEGAPHLMWLLGVVSGIVLTAVLLWPLRKLTMNQPGTSLATILLVLYGVTYPLAEFLPVPSLLLTLLVAAYAMVRQGVPSWWKVLLIAGIAGAHGVLWSEYYRLLAGSSVESAVPGISGGMYLITAAIWIGFIRLLVLRLDTRMMGTTESRDA